MQKVEQETGKRSLLKMYNASFKSPFSARAYTYNLNYYANNDLESLLKLSQKEAEDKLIDFIITNKEQGMTCGTINNYVVRLLNFI